MSPNVFSRIRGRVVLALAGALAGAAGVACSETVGSVQSASAPPPVPYCPYLPSNTYASGVTVSGKAYYQYRLNGNGEIQDGGARVSVTLATNGTLYRLSIGGTNCASYTSDSSATRAEIAAGLASAVNSGCTGAQATATSIDVRISPSGIPSSALTIASTGAGSLSVTSHAIPNPIRHAEIRVSNSAGSLVQCAETDNTGAFSFELPAGSGSYSVAVASRSSNSSLRAYVLKSPNTNEHYSVAKSVGTSGNTSNLSIVAPGDGTLEGGAFNILDQFHKSNDFLRAETSNCADSGDSTYFPGCVSGFTVAPMAYAYWAKGVNPGTYFGSSSPVSFYLLGSNHLYLLCQAGNRGDCDHYDNSVVVHEYGHFIEDVYARPDSPGGSHDGQSIIDPRLAWGEGWADFFQAAVTGVPYYRDTIGNVDCAYVDGGNVNTCTYAPFNIDLESNAGGDDVPVRTGEGNFHEFSVARVLWHALDKATYYPSGPTTHSTARFSEIWTVLAHPTTGFKNASYAFRNVGLFHKIQQAQTGATNWTTIRANEKHRGDLTDYATPVTLGSGANCLQTITPQPDISGALADSDQFNNNDFYDYSHPGGAFSAALTCSSNCGNDLDIYVWKRDYAYAESASLVAAAANANTSAETAVTSLPAGRYMVNVNVNTVYANAVGSPTQYQLWIGGQRACPNP